MTGLFFLYVYRYFSCLIFKAKNYKDIQFYFSRKRIRELFKFLFYFSLRLHFHFELALARPRERSSRLAGEGKSGERGGGCREHLISVSVGYPYGRRRLSYSRSRTSVGESERERFTGELETTAIASESLHRFVCPRARSLRNHGRSGKLRISLFRRAAASTRVPTASLIIFVQ